MESQAVFQAITQAILFIELPPSYHIFFTPFTVRVWIGVAIVTLLSTLLLSRSVTTPQEREEFTLAKCAIFAIGGVTFVRFISSTF